LLDLINICYFAHLGEPQFIILHQHTCLTALQQQPKGVEQAVRFTSFSNGFCSLG